MDPRDTVAIILAIGLCAVLLSGTSFRWIWLPIDPAPPTTEVTEAWTNIVNVLIGALAGYIAGRKGGS